jgi:hypothetical protein
MRFSFVILSKGYKAVRKKNSPRRRRKAADGTKRITKRSAETTTPDNGFNSLIKWWEIHTRFLLLLILQKNGKYCFLFKETISF